MTARDKQIVRGLETRIEALETLVKSILVAKSREVDQTIYGSRECSTKTQQLDLFPPAGLCNTPSVGVGFPKV